MKDHDKTVQRIILTLNMLNEDKLPSLKELASEFNVSQRTIQRDIYERLHMFPIEKTAANQFKFADGFQLGYTDISSLEEYIVLHLALSQFRSSEGSLKLLSNRLIKKMLKPGIESHFFIKSENSESLDLDASNIKKLQQAIDIRNSISFTYHQLYCKVYPYKIVNFDGIWYLFAKDSEDGKIKTFVLSHLLDMRMLEEKYTFPQNIDAVLDNVHTAWFEDGASFEVIVKVAASIAHFFILKKHLSSQKIIQKNQDGSLHIKFVISTEEDLDNLVKAWLPHIEVLKPASFRLRMINELKSYIKLLEIDLEL